MYVCTQTQPRQRPIFCELFLQGRTQCTARSHIERLNQERIAELLHDVTNQELWNTDAQITPQAAV